MSGWSLLILNLICAAGGFALATVMWVYITGWIAGHIVHGLVKDGLIRKGDAWDKLEEESHAVQRPSSEA